MDPSAETDTGVLTFSAYVRETGTGPLLAVAAGLAILVLGIRLAPRGGTRSFALALFGASWLALLPALSSDALDPIRTFVRVTLRWTDPGAEAMAHVVGLGRPNPAALFAASVGLLLGLAGSVAALARSRPDAAARPAMSSRRGR